MPCSQAFNGIASSLEWWRALSAHGARLMESLRQGYQANAKQGEHSVWMVTMLDYKEATISNVTQLIAWAVHVMLPMKGSEWGRANDISASSRFDMDDASTIPNAG